MEDLRSSRACCGLVPTAPTEDALRTIFVLSGRGDEVTTSALARHLGVAPPTVSMMLKRLAEHGLVERTPDHRASLTPHGARHARHVVRRHRLLETFLVRVVGLGPHEVHDEADALEHAISDRLLDRIDACSTGRRTTRTAIRSPGPATPTSRGGAPGSPTPPSASSSGSSACRTGTGPHWRT